MSKIWEFFENLGEYVYVADAETHELIYMNKKTLKSYGFQSLEEIIGLKCYEILQGNSLPCGMCNNEQLKPGFFKEWEYYNPLLRRELHIKDTLVEEDGRKYRMEIAIDCGNLNGRGHKSEDYRNMEVALNEAIRVAQRQESMDQTLQVLLEFVGKNLEAGRAYIFEKDDHDHDHNTYEWVAKGEMKDVDPQMYEVLVRQNIHSLVVVPLYDDGKVIGFYGVDNPSTRYFEFVSEMLQIMGHFIVSSLKQRNLVRELEVMSYSDPLTTLGNRYAMERYIEQVDHTEPIGVVYCDITGLKRINDSEGHSAGDRLIRRCCDCLKRVFEGNGMFRIGGDELVVLCTGISEKEFYQKVEELKTELAAHDVSMAVGAAVNTLEAVGKDHLLTESERRMYQDKAEYYRSTGLDRRKI